MVSGVCVRKSYPKKNVTAKFYPLDIPRSYYGSTPFTAEEEASEATISQVTRCGEHCGAIWSFMSRPRTRPRCNLHRESHSVLHAQIPISKDPDKNMTIKRCNPSMLTAHCACRASGPQLRLVEIVKTPPGTPSSPSV